MDLKECRREIDVIDEQILDLFARRMDVSAQVAAYKKEHGLPVLDAAREREKLNEVLSRLVDAGNTLVVIEHNPDVIKTADYLIDMGPEGGDLGGHVVARGTPEQVALCPESYTGQCMRPILGI